MSTLVAAPLATDAVLAGRYRIVRALGVGAWGRVYLATDTADLAAPQVAIKEMHGDDSAPPDEQREAIAWFKREVSTLHALEHPGIPRVHGYWTAAGDHGPFYLAMDYVPGKTLEEVLTDCGGPLPWREAAEIGIGQPYAERANAVRANGDAQIVSMIDGRTMRLLQHIGFLSRDDRTREGERRLATRVMGVVETHDDAISILGRLDRFDDQPRPTRRHERVGGRQRPGHGCIGHAHVPRRTDISRRRHVE